MKNNKKRILKRTQNGELTTQQHWIKTVGTKEAKWKRNGGLFTPQLIKASLQSQPATIDFLEKEFDLKFSDLLLVD